MASIPEVPSTSTLPLENWKSFPISAGIYFIYSAEFQLLYIGQTRNFRTRLQTHLNEWGFRWPFARVRIQICANRTQRICRERELILKHQPPLNRQYLEPQPPLVICYPEAYQRVLHDEGVLEPLRTNRLSSECPLFSVWGSGFKEGRSDTWYPVRMPSEDGTLELTKTMKSQSGWRVFDWRIAL